MTSPLPDSAHWDKAAADYEALAEPFTRQYAEQALTLAGGIRPGERVLDVAAGTGALALAAARAGAHVLGIDFSPGMVARLTARFAEGGYDGGEARVMDGQALDLPDASFDAAFSIFGAVLFPDWRRGLAELARVVRPSGCVCVATWARETGAGPSLALHEAYRTAFPDKPAVALAPGLARLKEPAIFAEEMRAAGFADVAVHTIGGAWGAESPAAAAEQMQDFFHRFPLYAELSDVERPVLHDAFRDILRRYETADGVVIPSEAHVAIGRR